MTTTLAVTLPASAATRRREVAAPAPTAGGIGLRLVDTSAAADADPRARVYIVDHLAPGAVINRRVEVSNTTDAAERVALYTASASIERGSFLGAAGHTQNDLSTWTAVRPGAIDLPAGGRATAVVTIAVPPDAAPGEQYGVVWAEVSSGRSGVDSVRQVNRVGIRIYLSVGPGGAPATDFTVDALTATRDDDGRPTVLATVHNTGGRALDMRGSLELLAGPGGLRAGPFPASLGITLGLGETSRVTIALDDQLPAGPWDAQITLHSGTVERTARATITFPATGAAPSVATTSPGGGWPRPVSAGLAGVSLMVAAGLLLHLARTGRGRYVDSTFSSTAPPRVVVRGTSPSMRGTSISTVTVPADRSYRTTLTTAPYTTRRP